jgi:folate-dependent phosphoribosylglycinamide formyltransferase PurN
MIDGRPWIAMFSHTGSEIINISKKLGITPEKVITNKPPGSPDINKQLLSNEIVYSSAKPTAQDYSRVLRPDAIVTLHGWMRIVPPRICKEYEIYNLHPGLITKYPELKGADPQKRVAEEPDENKYTDIGCVIHRVTPGVDEGPVLMEVSCSNNVYGEVNITNRLHEIASGMWVDFIQHKVYNMV